MVHRLLRRAWLLGALFIAGCGPYDEPTERLDDEYLDADDSYRLFRATPNEADEVAVLVEMRNAPGGTYVLMHTAQAPKSTGWFELEPTAFEQCREAGEHMNVELSCLIPDGYGELVDIVTVPPKKRQTVVMRHAFSKCGGKCAWEESGRAMPDGYYAVMRLERVSGAPIMFAIEARSLDGSGAPTIARVR